MTEIPSHPDSLLRHQAWLRRLAGALVSDHHAAEDLTQDTLLAALGQPGPNRSGVRTWLAGILWRRAKDRARVTGRRERREQMAARQEALPGTVETLALFERFRSIVEAVRELDEPMRTAVLLRYWNNLSPRQIAAQLEIPVETVRTRLKRAMHRLRKRLDDDYDARIAWAAPLAGLGAPGTKITSWTPVVGGMWMATKFKAALICACILFGTWFAFHSWSPGSVDPAAMTDGEIPAAANSTGSATPARETLGAGATPFAFADGTRVVGRLVDEDGHAAPRMLLVFTPEGSDEETDWIYAPTDHRGDFVADRGLAPGMYSVRIRVGRPLVDPRTITIDGSRRNPLGLIVHRPGPRDSISGTVVYEDGTAAAGIGISVGGRLRTATNSLGAFKIRRPADARDARARLLVSGPGVFPDVAVAASHEWGSIGVRIRMRPGAGYRILALRADTLEPVMEFTCRTPLRRGGMAQGGIVAMRSSPWYPGRRWRVTIVPKAADLLPRTITLRRHDLRSTEPIRVLVPVARPGRFWILDRRGEPVVHALVEMVRSHIEHMDPGFDHIPHSLRRDGTWSPTANLIAWGHTDETGHIELSGEAFDDDGPTLLISGTDIAPAVVDPGDSVRRDGVHVVTIPRGARLRGLVTNFAVLKDAVNSRPYWVLETSKGRVTRIPPHRFDIDNRIDEQGRFEARNIPPGTWTLRISSGPVLTRIDLHDGEDREITLDAKTLFPASGTVRGTVRVLGQPGGILLDSPSATTDDHGDFGPEEMTAGTYSLNLSLRIAGKRRFLRDVAEYEVLPNETTRIHVNIEVVKVGVELVTIDGQPVPFERIYLRRGDETRYDVAADVKGRAVFFLQKGRKYDVALRPIDCQVGPPRAGNELHVSLGSFVVGESGSRLAFVVR